MMGRAAACARVCVLALLAACGIEAVGTGTAIDGSAASSGSSSGAPSSPAADSAPIVDFGDGDTTANIGVDANEFVDAPSDSDAGATCTADLNTSLAHCGACFAACPTGSTKCSAGQCYATLRIRVGIDGESHFWWKGSQAQWHQTTYAAPARHPDTPLPLELNGQVFNPTWPDANNDPQNYSCNCESSFMTVPVPPLPARAQNIGLEVVAYRVAINIVEQPSAANNYRLDLRFYDVGMGGSEYYEAVLTYQTR